MKLGLCFKVAWIQQWLGLMTCARGFFLACMHNKSSQYIYIYAYPRTYIHTHIHTCIHPSSYTRIHSYGTYIHKASYIHAWMNACSTYVRAYVHAWVHTYNIDMHWHYFAWWLRKHLYKTKVIFKEWHCHFDGQAISGFHLGWSKTRVPATEWFSLGAGFSSTDGHKLDDPIIPSILDNSSNGITSLKSKHNYLENFCGLQPEFGYGFVDCSPNPYLWQTVVLLDGWPYPMSFDHDAYLSPQPPYNVNFHITSTPHESPLRH